MFGWNLKSGSITEYDVSEDRIWSLSAFTAGFESRLSEYMRNTLHPEAVAA